jgi:hypothetical protein
METKAANTEWKVVSVVNIEEEFWAYANRIAAMSECNAEEVKNVSNFN